MGTLTPGATWHLTKQAGISDGAAEIHTNFKVSGNFTIDLTVNQAALGTGEVGLRLGDQFAVPWAELFLQESNAVKGSVYGNGSYRLSGFGLSMPDVTLRMSRTGSTLRYYANRQQFMVNSFIPAAAVTIFLRPWSGTGAFNPGIGQPDAHVAVLDQLTITADSFVFVPEPGSVWLVALAATVIGSAPRRRQIR